MQGRFERFKCSFGSAASSAIPIIPLPIIDLPRGCDFPNLGIEGSKMLIARFVNPISIRSYVFMLKLGKRRIRGSFQRSNKWHIKPYQ